jgi:tetratricopeptide (TPR) repeat protein
MIHDYAYALSVQGHHDQAMEYWKLLATEAKAEKATKFETMAWWRAAHDEWSRGNNDVALENLQQAETLAREAQDDALLVRVLWLKGWCELRADNLSKALDAGREALEKSKTANNPEQEAHTYNLMAVLANYEGEFDKCRAYFERALAIQEELGDKATAAMTTNNIGYMNYILGDYETAITRYDQALEQARNLGRRHDEHFYRGNRAGTLVQLGRFEEAIKDLHEVLDYAAVTRMAELSEFTRFLAEAYLGQKNYGKALQTAHQALELGLNMKNPEYIGTGWRVLAQVAAQVDEMVEIELDGEILVIDPDERFAESEKILSEVNILSELARTLKEWARYDLAQGLHDSAMKKWKRTRAIYETIDAQKEIERMSETPLQATSK